MKSLLQLAPGDRFSFMAVLVVAVSARGIAGCAQDEPEHDMGGMAMEGMSHDEHQMTPLHCGVRQLPSNGILNPVCKVWM